MDNDQIQHQGREWLESLLKFSGLDSDVESNISAVAADGSCWLTINSVNLTSEQIKVLIGEKGAVLDSIQYLVNTTLNLGVADDHRQAYTVELDGYRVERQEELQAIAQSAVQQARNTGEEVELIHLSSAERRQIHTFLKAAFEGVETFSRGQEPDRRLVIRLIEGSEG